MKKYNPYKGLIFIHIAKCAGTSVNAVLKTWFGENFYRHSFKQNKILPQTSIELKPGVCISGHFNKKKGKGTREHYPEADQFFTFLRDPLDVALSNYYHWKRKRREIMIKAGTLKEGSQNDYKNIEDYFKRGNKSFILNFMPCEMTVNNYKDMFHKYFVYAGIVEDLQTSIDVLANKLGSPPTKIEHLNRSTHNETVSEKVRNEFINNNQLEYLIYNYILSEYKQ